MLRKGLLSKGKKKWIIGGALLFGGVSLLTTGFATWIVGINQLRQNLGTVVQVEGTLNESVKLVATASSTPDALGVNIGENHPKGSNEIIGNSDGETEVTLTPFKDSFFDLRPETKSVVLEDDILMFTNEYVVVNRRNKDTRLIVVPINYMEYSRLMSKPFKRPIKNQAWRLLDNSGGQKKAEIIIGPNDTI